MYLAGDMFSGSESPRSHWQHVTAWIWCGNLQNTHHYWVLCHTSYSSYIYSPFFIPHVEQRQKNALEDWFGQSLIQFRSSWVICLCTTICLLGIIVGEVNSQSPYPSSTCDPCELFWQHRKRKLFRIAKYMKRKKQFSCLLPCPILYSATVHHPFSLSVYPMSAGGWCTFVSIWVHLVSFSTSLLSKFHCLPAESIDWYPPPSEQ
jgi:hypothetical protein